MLDMQMLMSLMSLMSPCSHDRMANDATAKIQVTQAKARSQIRAMAMADE